MRTSDLENDIKRLLASTQSHEGAQKQLSCRVSAVCHHQIGVLANKVNMTRTALAERLLEQATAIAWGAAGLGDLGDEEINAINAAAKSYEAEKADRASESMEPDETTFSRIACIHVVFRHLGLTIGKAKESLAIAVSGDSSTRICCLTSKDYEAEKPMPEGEHYWFTIYERQLENIQLGRQSYVAFGCGSTDEIVLIPASEFSTWTKDLPPYTQGKVGWHVHLRKASGRLELRREGRGEPSIDVTRFVI